MKLKIVFIGGAKRASTVLRSIVKRKDIAIEFAIFTEGYDYENKYCEVLVNIAKENNIEYVLTDKITAEIKEKVKDLKPEVIFGGGTWRSMVDKEFRELAPYGYISFHGTGLPYYRGWAGINWYIANGEKEYVNRMFQLDDGIDSGPLVANKEGNVFELRIDIDNDKHVAEILEEVYPLRVKVFNDLLDSLVKREIKFIPQDETLAGYTCNRSPEDGEIDWTKKTKEIFNFVRAQSHPYPGAFSFYKNKLFHVWRASIPKDARKYVGIIPGKIVERGPEGFVDVLTADGVLRIHEISVNGDNLIPSQFLKSVRQTLGYKVRDAIENLEQHIKIINSRLI
ncbi:MAG: hypothetical protein GY721_12145 [Deltaproteobacteria bacterium]|nr:hypothetical protein [Deltaproteobacteria bacterium]